MARLKAGAEALDRLEARLGLRFGDRARLQRALTHSSLKRSPADASYERLEFLGDRVLGLVIAQKLFETHPKSDEGDLSLRLNTLVSAQTCAAVADEIGLPEFIRHGADLKRAAAGKNRSIRADVVEALIAAIYLEHGLETARAFVLERWASHLEGRQVARRDPKTELQEWAHKRAGRPRTTSFWIVRAPTTSRSSPCAPRSRASRPPKGAARRSAWPSSAPPRRSSCARASGSPSPHDPSSFSPAQPAPSSESPDLTDNEMTPETETPTPETQGPTRSGFVALLGAPNAGKSTLVNQLVGTKVSIVTHKVQTTRALVRGIAMRDRTQIVFVDTPGVFNPKRRLDRAMVKTAWGGAKDADIVLPIIDADRGVNDEVEAILERLKDVKQPKVLLLNKVDRIKRDKLLGLTQEVTAKAEFERVFMISALTGSGCDDLMEFLAQRLPEGPGTTPRTRSPTCRCASSRRDHAREALPAPASGASLFIDRRDRALGAEAGRLGAHRADDLCRARQQKAIVLGHKGETIKAIGSAARKEITEAAEQKVHLFLFVKVRENWGDDPERYREMGLDFHS